MMIHAIVSFTAAMQALSSFSSSSSSSSCCGNRWCCFALSQPSFSRMQVSFGCGTPSHHLPNCANLGCRGSMLSSLPVRKLRSEASELRCSPESVNEQPQIWMQEFRVPEEWATPSAAVQEAEWLRANLHDWLDNEYCPEPANIEISQRCANVYRKCLLENKLDIGDILIHISSSLENFSFKESFHGPFSSANAAVDLIMQRVRSFEKSS